LSNFNARDFALNLLKEPTSRDKQQFVGASQFSSPCTYCVAASLQYSYAQMQGHPHVPKEPNRYWLGAVIGTAVHGLFEERGALAVPTAVIEKKIYLGTLEGYGEIWSKPDFLHVDERICLDWKTTTRAKLRFLKEASNGAQPEAVELSGLIAARYTFQKYLGQLMSYARGLVLLGYEIDTVSMVFVCRDGLTDDDVWAYTTAYDPDYAEKVFDRLVRLWEYVHSGQDINDLPSKSGCFECETEGRV